MKAVPFPYSDHSEPCLGSGPDLLWSLVWSCGWASSHLQLHCCAGAAELIDCTQISVNEDKITGRENTHIGYLVVLNISYTAGSKLLFMVLGFGCFCFYFLLLQVQCSGLNHIHLALSGHVFSVVLSHKCLDGASLLGS